MSDRADSDSETEGEFRPPIGLVETLTANSRWQPAIPALLVLFMTLSFILVSAGQPRAPEAEAGIANLLVPLALAVSCGLAIAAGFCSVFPTLSWIVVAAWALQRAAVGGLPVYSRWVLLAGIIAAMLMTFFQIWRVATGRFIPTVRVTDDDSAENA